MRHETSRLRRLTLASSAAPSVLVATVTGLEASPESRRLTREVYDLADDLRVKESLALLSRARAVDPADLAPARAVAAVTGVKDGVYNGILIGMGAGLAAGLVAGLLATSPDDRNLRGMAIMLAGAAGLGVGIGLGAAIDAAAAHLTLAYRAPTTLRVAPFAAPGGYGAVVAVA